MNIVEAVKTPPDKWFRPLSWRGSGMALYCHPASGKGHYLLRVPGLYGGEVYAPTVSEIQEEYEVVDPAFVLQEGRDLLEARLEIRTGRGVPAEDVFRQKGL